MMSDLNDFFAKKDRKKKRAATRSTVTAPTSEGKKPEKPAEPVLSAPVQKQPDDGWIEIEDPKGAPVYTGGRTVVEFKRDVEDKEHNGDGIAPTEKFSGWTKEPDVQEGNEDEGKEPTAAPVASAAFPSLADAADAPEVPVSRGKSSSSSGYSSSAGRPRFITNPEKLRQKLAERRAAPAGK